MKRHYTPTFFKGAQSVRTSEYWQMAVVFESQPPSIELSGKHEAYYILSSFMKSI